MPQIILDNQVIKYIETGIGEPIIFIHGVGMDHTMWNDQMNFLASQYRIIAYDMIGHGESAKPKGDYKLINFVEQLRVLMDGLEIEKAHVIGFSMGGMVAQLFGVVYPKRVRSLCIMSAVANRTTEQQKAVLDRVKQVESYGHVTTIDAALARWFNESYYNEHSEIITTIRDRLATNDPTSYLKAYKVFATADQEIWEKLEQIDSPTLIITGEEDIGSSPEMSRQMHKKIKGSELIIVPSIRHMLPIEGKDIVNQILHTFVTKHSHSTS
jgi:pimeloyl-ACP methyl ester carboxylesterase